MLPILKELNDGREKNIPTLKALLVKEFDLSEKQLKELLPSGTQPIFDNRVGWARTYLKKAGLIESPKRGVFRITDRGRSVLEEDIGSIDSDYLYQFEEFKKFKNLSNEIDSRDIDIDENSESTPIEKFESSYKKIKDELKADLLDQIFNCSPFFFEKLVVDLLLNLGYGGSRKEAGEAFATTGDEGIDGVIKEDKLGLDLIYIQAKRWKVSSCVGRPEIQKFAGALQGKRAKKGIFLTTSYFSNEAKSYVETIDSKIILIDGGMLTNLMFESSTGVSIESKYEIKKIDSDYFTEE